MCRCLFCRDNRLQRRDLNRRNPACDFNRRADRLFKQRCQRHAGDGKAFHVQRRHQRRRADQIITATTEGRLNQIPRDQTHLQRRHAAKIIHQQCAWLVVVRHDLLQQMLHNLLTVLRLHHVNARLAVDPQPHFNAAVRDTLAGLFIRQMTA